MFRCLFALLLAVLASLAGASSRTLRAGDQVRLYSAENASLCVTRVIDGQGWVRVPGAGAVLLEGLSMEEATKALARAAHLAMSDVSLELVPIRFRGVLVYGAVTNIGEVTPSPDMRLADLLRIARPTIGADLDQIEIESDTGQLLTVAFDPNPLRPESNPYMRSGDRVVVPIATGTAQISVLGGVGKPGPTPYVRGMTVKAALDASGGVSNHGTSHDVRVLRGGLEVRRLDLNQSADTELKRGDTIVVAMVDSRRYVTVVGEVKGGGLIPWKDGMTLAEAIQDAGGSTEKGDVEALRVQRMLGDSPFRKQMAISKDKDYKLMANDVIQVPLKGSTPPPPKPAAEPGPRRVVPPL